MLYEAAQDPIYWGKDRAALAKKVGKFSRQPQHHCQAFLFLVSSYLLPGEYKNSILSL